MGETYFEEMKRYVRFTVADENALRALAPLVRPHFRRIAEEFYQRLHEHEEARQVFSGPDQVERLKGTLCVWMELLFTGPWDEEYYQKRARIGKMHVKISLPQRYMFGAMNLMRLEFQRVAMEQPDGDGSWSAGAVARIVDLELAIMLETYREAFVDQVQQLERLERSLLERRLAISEARYEEIVEKSEALIITADADGRVQLFNRRAEELTGIDRRLASGRELLDLLAPAADRENLADYREKVLAGERVPPYEGKLPTAVTTNQPRRVRWHFTTLPGGATQLLCAMGLDVTEEHDLAVRTRRAERLAALGTMAAGLAHEIRNPLNAAHLQLTLVQRRLGRPTGADVEGAAGAAGLASSEIKRLGALVEEFLQFARPQPLRLMRVDLRATTEAIVDLLHPEALAGGVDLAVEPGPRLVTDADDERLKQVLLNLIRNAVEASGRGGRVRVRVLPRDGSALIEVEDDGPGIPSPDAPVFEPFFTTKPSGTGLGLAIAHRIVSDHGGRIGFETRPGRTVFWIAIPLIEG